MSVKRAALLATACLLPITAPGLALAQDDGTRAPRGPRRPGCASAAPSAPAPRRPPARRPARAARAAAARRAAQRLSQGTIQAIRVEGNQRIETGTIQSYMLVRRAIRSARTASTAA